MIARICGLSLLLALVALRVADPVFVSTIRNQSFDVLQRLQPRPEAKFPVVIVDIDEASLQSVGQWPWPRSKVAALVDRLTEMGAVTIGFDIVFAEPDRLSPERIAQDNDALPEATKDALRMLPSNELLLADAIRRSRVVVGETSARDTTSLTVEESGTNTIAQTPYAALGNDPLPFLLHYPRLVQNIGEISQSASGHGVFTVDPDPDGVFRRMPLVMMVQDRIRLGLSAEMLRIATGGQAFAMRADEAGLSGIVVGGVFVPTDGTGRVWPWFNASSRERYVSAGSVLSGAAPPSKIAGHMVLVGTSAVGLEDFRATPVAAFMPGVEIHAQIIENILGQQLLQRPSYAIGMEVFFILLLGLLIIWLVPKLGAMVASLAAISIVGLFAIGSVWAFYSSRLLIDSTFPLASLTAVFMVMATANYLREERQKRDIRRAFGQYLSPSLVDRLANDPGRLVLGGETRPLTLLFTDVRGFTTISESYKAYPQGLTRLMNRFLTALSKPILDRQGTIDKYMGDAIMAFWNAPIDLPNHASIACRAALDMMRTLEELNAVLMAEAAADPLAPVHEIKIGIGINTGECVVGNMGSDMRFDYTALGDTVNLASRLEGQSKPYGISIILGEGTAREISSVLATIEIDLIRVKGKTEPERIYALLGAEDMSSSEAFSAFKALNADMLASYRAQDWDATSGAIASMRDAAPRIGLDLSNYLDLVSERVAAFRAAPPGPEWDGVYVASTK